MAESVSPLLLANALLPLGVTDGLPFVAQIALPALNERVEADERADAEKGDENEIEPDPPGESTEEAGQQAHHHGSPAEVQAAAEVA